MLTDPLFFIIILTLILVVLVLGGGTFIFLRRRGQNQAPAKKQTSFQPAEKGKGPKSQKKAADRRPSAFAEPATPAASPEPAAPAATPAASSPPQLVPAFAPTAHEGDDKIRILVVDDNPDTRGHVTRLLYFEEGMDVIGQARNGREGIEMAVEMKPHIVLMDINMPDMDGISATKEMSLQAPFSQVIIMSVQAEQHYMKQAMAAGARDFQPKPFTAEELISCVRRVYKIGEPAYRQFEAAARQETTVETQSSAAELAHSDSDTPVIAVYSPKGGIGTSTVAVNLAIAMQQTYGDVALMDADLQFGDILVHTNTRPTRTISDLIHDGQPDLELLPDVLLPHNSGLKLLLAPPQPELADAVSPEMLGQVLDALKQSFRAVVVDTHSKLDDRTLAVLEAADYILALTAPELPAIKSAKQFLEVAELLEFKPERLGIVINRANQPGGIPVEKIEQILKLPHSYQVAYDPRMAMAVNKGVALTLQEPNAPAARSISHLARQVWNRVAAASEDAVPERA
jgi:pilus assembly protein CpaE